MQVWIPFSPVQHVDCGCLVPERNGPRRRHRDTARPSTSAAPSCLDRVRTRFVYWHYFVIDFHIMHVGMGIFRSCFYQVRHRS
jgi:hypothetical protein